MSEELPRRGGGQRRRRRRATSAQGAPTPTPNNAPDAPPAPKPTPRARPGGPTPEAASGSGKPARRRRPVKDAGERGLRDLVGAGPSQLGVDGALRGRDVDRPTEEDLAEAERDVVIVRRHWQPHDAPARKSTS